MTQYTIDTNVIVDMNRDMPRDVWLGVWDSVERLIADRRAFMPRQVFEELKGVDDDCAPWARDQPGFVVEATDAEVQVVLKGVGVEDRNLGIPNVAREWSVECLRLPDLARREGWQFL